MKTKLVSLCLPIFSLLLFSTFAIAQTYSETIVYSFGGSTGDGQNPWGGLVMDAAGNLYGTTSAGGDASCVGHLQNTCGTVFKIDPAGNETVLHAFTGGTDGENPLASLVMDKSGNLYGATPYGGLHHTQGGTVFKITPSGKYVVLHRFGGAPDGQTPYGSLTLDAAGNIYGTTFLGGNSTARLCQPQRGPKGCGTVFKLSPTGKETILYNFNLESDGGLPSANVILDAQGNIYGGTSGAGANNYGTLFKLTPSGTFTVLYNFCSAINCTDGAQAAYIAMDGSGNIFGYTGSVGPVIGSGLFAIAFEYSTAGVETPLYSFCAGFTCPSGSEPYGQVLLLNGNLYGTTYLGGAGESGSVYELTASGSESLLWSFDVSVRFDGHQPLSGVIADAAGNLYGTSLEGGNSGFGTVFKLTRN